MNLYQAFETYNFARRPDWRWERVLLLAGNKPIPRRPTRKDDEYVRAAREFIIRYQQRDDARREELFVKNPDLFYAYKLHELEMEDADTAMMVQARILANQTDDQIFEATGILPGVVDMYEKLFFNVRDRLNRRDYISKRVLIPAMQRNFGVTPSHSDPNNPVMPWSQQVIARPFLDASIKMFAYFAGPVVMEFLLHSFQTGKMCQSQDDMARFLDDHWATTLRARSSQAVRTFEINKFNVIELFGIHARLMEIEKSDETMDQKRNQIERHIGGLMDEIEHVYSIGDEANEATPLKLKTFDTYGAELRDREVMSLSSGNMPDGLDDLDKLRIPAPKKQEVTDASKRG